MIAMEILDVYDINGEKLSRTLPRGTMPGENEFFLVVHTCVINPRGEMLLQQRQITKDRYPGCWDVSAGGFASSGEDSITAALRELQEELGVECDKSALRFVVREPFKFIFDDFYICLADIPLESLTLQKEEVMGAKWADEQEVMRLLAAGELVDYDAQLLEKVFRAADEH